MNHNYVLNFSEIDRTSGERVGGKGANLGELYRIPEIEVPPGFCIVTDAFDDFVNTSREYRNLLHSLQIAGKSRIELQTIGASLRSHLENLEIPAPIQDEILRDWQISGCHNAYAVRSSATAEDLPGASFAGQQDTFLNVKGKANLLYSIKKCWASLFSDRAIVYRSQNGFPHDQVKLAVIVQRMIFPDISGIMFTADPVTGNRKVISIDASFGLGEALVSGLVSADFYQIKSDKVIHKKIARKEVEIRASKSGGTVREEIEEERKTVPSLSEENALRLAGIGRRIQAHFGSPQDIEWCLDEAKIFILQSRPITTLYPLPLANDNRIRLYLSFGHPQMMTDAMKPLGISVLRTLVPFGKDRPGGESCLLKEAGSRLYFDVTPLLHYPQVRKRLPSILPAVDESIGRAVQDFITREEFRDAMKPDRHPDLSQIRKIMTTILTILRNILYRDNHQAIDQLNCFIREQVQENRCRLKETSDLDRIVLIQNLLSGLLLEIIPRIAPYLPAGIGTYIMIENLSQKWLGDNDELPGISKSPAGNVTTEMGLQLGDLADALRNYSEVIEYLEHTDDAGFLTNLTEVAGGKEMLPFFQEFLQKYGMRGTGEIDITRPRWREEPTRFVPMVLSYVKSARPGQHRRNFEAGKKEAELMEARLVNRLRKKPMGFLKARIMQRLIRVYRSLIGMREHPKYYIVQNLDWIKQAIMQEANTLVAAGVLQNDDDIFWFSLPEIKEIIERQQADQSIIEKRKSQYRLDSKLIPPRAMTSEGEIINPRSAVRIPAGALVGSPVSAGTIEGRARVVLKLEEAHLNKGDILVAAYTDPSWTPLFPLAAGLVTEVGGLMTHGAVVAREYGIPAVVGVEGATQKIADGRLIRVNGTQGIIEFVQNPE
jgi:phosphoenolpyruvate synthase/pyruvate phosphate dikinase